LAITFAGVGQKPPWSRAGPDPEGYAEWLVGQRVRMLERADVLVASPAVHAAVTAAAATLDRQKKAAILQGIVQKYPGFPPAWKELSVLLQDPAARLHDIDRGLAGDPDAETKGMLLINRALLLQGEDRDAAIRILGELALDPSATLATETLATAMLKRIVS
jgi:hypothetical protein